MTRRILVVDDDQLMVKTLAEILRLQGWDTGTAYDGEAAVRAFQAEPYDVVLMDVRMPGMSGVDALRAMKAERPAVKVVLMTAYAAREVIAEAEDQGALRILSKPVNIPSLLGFLAATIERRRPVLVVDDDPAFLRTLGEVLQLRGFDTVMAESLGQAMLLMQQRRPAAILLHMHLADASAREAVRAVREIGPDVALILYSGQPGAEREINGDVPREWVHSYFQKPFPVDQVASVLRDVVSG